MHVLFLILALALTLAACTRENPEAPAAPMTSAGVPESSEAAIDSSSDALATETAMPSAAPPVRPVPEPALTPMNGPIARTSTPASRIPEEPDDCGASKLGEFVSQRLTAETRAKIAAASGAKAIRYIGAGDMVTMDYSPARLNAELGENGSIKRFRCG